jgi:Protein of unknown function (DUF1153)
VTNTSESDAKVVSGPFGTPLMASDLPPPDTRRWVIRRKAEVVSAVRGGLLSLEEACNRYGLTIEEIMAWQSSLDRYGLPGLKINRIDYYRRRDAINVVRLPELLGKEDTVPATAELAPNRFKDF